MASHTSYHILALNYEFPPIGGGGGNAHEHLLREWAHDPELHVDLVTATPEREAHSEAYSEQVRVHFLPLPKKSLHYWRRREVIHYLVSHSRFLKQHLKTRTYDLCHVFFGFPSGLLAYRLRERMPYLVSVRGSDVPGFNPRFSWDYVLLRPLLKRIYHSAQAIVANSAAFGKHFEAQFPGLSARVIPNGIDLDTFSPRPRPACDTLHLCTVARLIPRKGIDLLIHACRGLHEAGVNFQCHVVGEGPEEERLRRLARELGIEARVTFHGRVERVELAAFLPTCDLFVLPSYAEGMSNAALEAMACGLPLILTETGGSHELVLGNGLLIPTGAASALQNALLQLCRDDRLRGEMAKASRQHAQRFGWKDAARQYRDLFVEVIESQGR